MDESEEWDSPQCWPGAESEVLNQALRLLFAERGKEEIKCKMRQGKQKENPHNLLSALISSRSTWFLGALFKMTPVLNYAPARTRCSAAASSTLRLMKKLESCVFNLLQHVDTAH